MSPPSFLLRVGANVTLDAIWANEDPLCQLQSLWYRWAVEVENATGYLNVTSGSAVDFVAESFTSGTSEISVRAAAVLVCGVNETFVERVGWANASVDVPLDLTDLAVTPNPLVPDQTAVFEGNLEGGEPPYFVTVSWGDGSDGNLTLAAAGEFSLAHRFLTGAFLPSVLVTDADGETAHATVVEQVSAGSGLEVGIVSSEYQAEVGIPVEFTGRVEGSSGGDALLFDCSNASEISAGNSTASANATDFDCTFAASGTAEVLFGAYSTQPGGPSATAVLYEPVAGGPTVTIEPVNESAAIGRAEPLRVCVHGGQLPINLSWAAAQNGTGGSLFLPTDGSGIVLGWPRSVGSIPLDVRVVDSAGVQAVNDSATMLVQPSLTAEDAATSSLRGGRVWVALNGIVLTGCAPFQWWTVASEVPANFSDTEVSLAAAGNLSWNTSYSIEGSLSIQAGVVDACGATWESELQVSLIPPLSIVLNATGYSNASDRSILADLIISGGAPPFRVELSPGGTGPWNESAAADGEYRWLLATNATGPVRLSATVLDLAGDRAYANASAWLSAPKSESTPPSVPGNGPKLPGTPANASVPVSRTSVAGLLPVLVVPIVVAVGLVIARRRWSRRPTGSLPEPDPVETLRKLVEPADGAERFTVELLAEEAGIPLGTVRATIDRLVREGRLLAERGADGEEVLSWSSEGGH